MPSCALRQVAVCRHRLFFALPRAFLGAARNHASKSIETPESIDRSTDRLFRQGHCLAGSLPDFLVKNRRPPIKRLSRSIDRFLSTPDRLQMLAISAHATFGSQGTPQVTTTHPGQIITGPPPVSHIDTHTTQIQPARPSSHAARARGQGRPQGGARARPTVSQMKWSMKVTHHARPSRSSPLPVLLLARPAAWHTHIRCITQHTFTASCTCGSASCPRSPAWPRVGATSSTRPSSPTTICACVALDPVYVRVLYVCVT